MPLFGKIVVIRRDGVDGAQFPLTTGTCIFGRNADCDIRVQLPNVAKEHCRIEVDSDGNIFLVNLCPVYPTLLNKKAVTERVQVQHMDVFTVTDRSFRVEFPPGSPFRKGRPSTDSVSPIQPTGSVKTENILEPSAVQPNTLMVKDETSLTISTNTEPSAAEKESSASKMGIKSSTPKGKTPTAKARTPSYLVRTPLQKGKTVSPALRASAKTKAKTPPGLKRGSHTPLIGQRSTNSRPVNTSTGTPRSKTPVSGSSLVKSNSALLADEIAELKMALTKHKGQTPARASVLKTPVGTARSHSVTAKAKTPASGDKIKMSPVTSRVRSNIALTPKSKTLVSASILKTPVTTPAAKTPVAMKSKGLATKTSSVHRIKKVMTPSPRAKAQKRRSSSIPSPVTEIAKKSPLRNILPPTDSLDARQDQEETVDSTLETSLEDKTSAETASFSGKKSQSQNLSPAKTLGRPKTGSPKFGSPTGPSTRRKSLSPVARSSGSYLARSKSQSPRWGPAKSSPQKMSQSTEKILTKKRRSSSSSNDDANKVTKDTPSHQISSPANNVEAVDSKMEIALTDKSSDEAVSSDGKPLSPISTAAEGHSRRKSRCSKVSSPSEPASRVKSQSPNTKTLSPLTRSPGTSLTQSKSQSPHRGPAKSRSPLKGSAVSSAEKMSERVETPALHRRSSTRPSVGAKQSPLRGKSHSPLRSSAEKPSHRVATPAMPRRSSSRPSVGAKQSPMHEEVLAVASSPNVPQAQIQAVNSIVANSFADTASGEVFSPIYKRLKSPKLSPAQAQIRRKSQGSPTRSPSSLTHSKPQSPLGSSAELSARRMSRSPATSSSRSKSQSPLGSPSEPAHKSLQHSNDSLLDSSSCSKPQSPQVSPGETSARRRSQSLEVTSPSKIQDSVPAVTDDCFLESYEQQFSPLILEMDDLDETKDSPNKTTPISGPRPKGGSDAESLKSAVGRLRRKSQPLLEESEDETLGTKSAGKETNTSGEFDQSIEERSFVSPSQGVKRRGSPLKGLPKKRRCVSFGPDMSPELFDRSLPVATPLKRGATPRRTSTSVDRLAVRPKPLLKTRRSMLSAAAAVLLEDPLEARSGKSPKDLKVMEKLSKGARQNPIVENMTTLNAEASASTDMERSQPVITPLKRQTKPRRASVVEAVVYPKSVRKSRRATLATVGVIPEAPLEENPEKSPKSSKVQGKESTVVVVVNVTASVDAEVLTASEIRSPVSSVASPVAAGSQNRKIFTSATSTRRLSRPLKTPSAASVTTSNENSPAVKTPVRKEKSPKLLQSLSPRNSHPLTNMQNSSVLHQELDPFAFESSPETSPAKLMPKPTSQSKNVEVNAAVSEDLATRVVLESVKKKLLSKSEEDITTPKLPLDFTVPRSAASLVKSSRSVERSSVKDVSLEQEHGSPETPTPIVKEGPRSAGRRSSKPQPLHGAVYETSGPTTPNIPRSTGRRSSRFLDKEQEEHVNEPTPVMDKSSSRRSTSSSKFLSAKTDGKATSEQVVVLEEKRSKSCDSAAKTPRSTGKRGQAKSEEHLKTPDAEVIGKPSAGSPALPAGDGVPTQRRFSERMSSSPFKRPFGSEPRKLRLAQVFQLLRQSPEEARRAGHAKNVAGKMVSERNIDLSSLSPLKFYKSPAVEALIGKRSKVTLGRAVALRAVYGKSAVPPLAELRVSRKASEMTNEDRSVKAEMADESAKSLPAEKSHSSKVSQRKKSSIQVGAKKNLEKKTGFAVKKKQTKVLVLKRVGRRSVGQVVKKLLPARPRNLRTKSDSVQEGQNSLPNIAENYILEVTSEKDQTLAELSKSPSSNSVLLTPNGPGEMSVSPWSSPVLVSSAKRRSGGKMAVVDDTSKGQNSPSFAGLTRRLVSPREGNSPNLSGMNSPVMTAQVESSPQLIGVKQLAKTPQIESSPQLSGVRKLVKTPTIQKSPQPRGVRKSVKTPKVQKSPQLSGVRNLMKTPKVQKSPQLSGIRNLVKTPKTQKSPKLSGIRNLVKTPKMLKSPKLSGVRNLVKTPKTQKSPKLGGVRNLVKTPKTLKSPKLSGVRELVKTPKVQESPDLTGVKALVKSPRQPGTPQLDGLKDLVSTPKVLSSPVLRGLNELVQSPATRNSLVAKTPKTQESVKREGKRQSVKTPKLKCSPRLGGVKTLVKTPKMRPTPKLSGLRNLVHTPKEIQSPEVEGVRELFQTPFMQQSAKKTRDKSPVKSPEVEKSFVQQSAKKTRAKSLVKSPEVEKSAKKTRDKSPVKSPEVERSFVQQSAKKTRDKSPVKSPEVEKSAKKTRDKSPVKSPEVEKSAKKTRDKSPVKSPEVEKSAKKTRDKSPVKSPEVKKSAKKTLDKSPVKSPEVERSFVQQSAKKTRDKSPVKSPEVERSFVQQSAKKTQDKSPVKSPEVNESSQFAAKLSSPKASAVKQITRNARGRNKSLNSSVTPIVTALNEPQEFAPLEDVTPVRAVIPLQKRASRAGVEKVADIPQLSMENVHNDENAGKDDKTVAAKTHKRKIAESDEKPAAKTRRIAAETEDSTNNDGKALLSAVKKGRGSKKVAAEKPSEIEVTASVSNAGGCLRKGKGEESAALQDEKLQVMSAALSPKLAVSRNSRSQRAKTTQVEEVTVEENVPATAEETVKPGARRQARLSKKDLPEELAVKSEDKAKSKTRAKGKGKATEVEMEVVVQETGTENVEVLIPPATEKSDGRQQSRARKNAIKEVVQAKAVVIAPERKSRGRGKAITAEVEEASEQVTVEENVQSSAAVKVGNRRGGRAKGDVNEELNVQSKAVVIVPERKGRARGKTTTTEVEMASEQVAVEENVESSAAVKVGNRRQGRAKGDANEELHVQSKTVVIVPERKSRAKAQGKTRQTEVEVEVNMEASVQETATLGSRRQVSLLKKGISEEADIQTEDVNKTDRKVSSRGKTKAQLAEAAEENLRKTVGPNVRNKKQMAKENAIKSSAVEETVEVKRPVRGRKTKSDGGKAEGKGRTVASGEAALAADDQTTGIQLNKTENAVVASGKRGRKGAFVEPVISDAAVITEVAQSSRKRKAKTVEEIAPTKAKKARMSLETAKEVPSPKTFKRGSRKAATGVASNNNLANEKLSAADNKPAAAPAASRKKIKTEITQVFSTTDEEVKTNSSEKKRGNCSSNKAKSAESSEAPKSKSTVTSRRQKTIEQTSNEVDFKPKGRPRKVKFDVPPTPAVDALEKEAQSTARGRSGASKRGSASKTASKELPATVPKARASRGISKLKNTAPPAKRAASRK